jgi:hypothetical protein
MLPVWPIGQATVCVSGPGFGPVQEAPAHVLLVSTHGPAIHVKLGAPEQLHVRCWVMLPVWPTGQATVWVSGAGAGPGQAPKAQLLLTVFHGPGIQVLVGWLQT